MRANHQAIDLVVFLTICFTAAAAGGAVTYPRIESWYAALEKPWWTPPDGLFGPVWTALYTCMAVAAWLVWKQKPAATVRLPMALFGLQLALNVLWSWLFFGLQSPGLAFAEIVLLAAAIAATLAAFWQRSIAAGLLLVPYLSWVGFAGALNFAIWRMNA